MSNQDKWEEEMERVIRERGREPVPESLKPDQMRERLYQQKRSIFRRRKRNIGRFCAAAAVLLVCGTGIWMRSGDCRLPDRGNGRVEVAEEKDRSSTAREAEGGTKEDAVEKLNYAESYQEIQEVCEQIVERYQSRMANQKSLRYGALVDTDYAFAEAEKNLADSSAGSAVSSELQYSQTNVSVEGIAEADLVHTDGEYIYRLRASGEGALFAVLDIIRVEGGEMKRIGTYRCQKEDSAGEGLSPQEFFLAGDQLILLSHVATEEGYYDTRITFIDIRDRKNPVKLRELTQSGSYEQARIKDGYLYTVSGSGWGRWGCVVMEDQKYAIPCVNGKKIPASRIYIPDGCDTAQFTTITSVRIEDGTKFADSRSIMAEAEYLHMTDESIYFVGDKWNGWEGAGRKETKKKRQVNATQITKFSYQKGNFYGKASVEVAGSVKDQFAVNEYNGTLRVISSIEYDSDQQDNAVYVLDGDLKVIGSIENLAEGERVYSARFQGDIGYFVTYRETDPLFSVDFSDPRHPKLLGELKIPGFSEYMHFYNDHLLFGLGLEERKGGQQCLKLSMFDVSDPKNVREIHKTLIKDMSYSEALYQYKDVLIDPEKNIIGFMCYQEDLGRGYSYRVYSYDEQKGFVCKVDATEDVKKAKTSERFHQPELTRGVYIRDTVYLLDLYFGSIWAYDFNTGKCLEKYEP